MLDTLIDDRYLVSDESDHVMIIEDRQIKTDIETGNKLIVTGRSLESILERRVIWGQRAISGNLQDRIEDLLNESIIAPTDADRAISNFVFEASTDPTITVLTIDTQFTGENLYKAIQQVCRANNIGFKIGLVNGQFVFTLYNGVDRSFDQIINPHVIFSPEFDNMLNSDYIESKRTLKTVSLVAGEGEGSERVMISVTAPNTVATNLNRREMYTDARDISQTVDSVVIPLIDYEAQLSQRGIENLADNTFIKSFEGQVESTIMFVYGVDFFLGDIVQIKNEYGIESRSRVTEMLNSQDASGINQYPTFTKVD